MHCQLISGTHILGKKWTVVIIEEIFFSKKRRFNELVSEANVSPKILAKRLKELEQKDLIRRKGHIDNGESYYILTRKGKEFQKVIDKIKDFYIKWENMPDCKNMSCTEFSFFKKSL